MCLLVQAPGTFVRNGPVPAAAAPGPGISSMGVQAASPLQRDLPAQRLPGRVIRQPAGSSGQAAGSAGQPPGSAEQVAGSPGPRGHPVACTSDESDRDEDHVLVSDAEAAEARAAAAAAAAKFGGPDHPEPLYMPGEWSHSCCWCTFQGA